MKTRLVVLVALTLLVVGADAGPLKIVNVNFPAIHCLFNTNCTITVADVSSPFTVTNAATTGFLQSRTYKGLPGTPESGLNGYMYRIGLNNLPGNGTNHSVTIDSLQLSFNPVSSFTYNGQTNNQLWIATVGGLGSIAPGSALQMGSRVTIRFNPPLVISGGSRQELSTYFFGMISPLAPTNSTATLIGSAMPLSGIPIPLTLTLPARTP
jgi:hypothetical protein